MKKQTIIIGIVALAVILGGVCFAGLGEKQKEDQKEKQITETIPAPTIAEQKPADTSAADTSQSGKIDEHLTINNELRDVNFCGKTYKVKQVLIDGVDVVQRVAELATKNLIPESFPAGPKLTVKEQTEHRVIIKKGQLAKSICENANPNTSLGIIKIYWMEKFVSKEQSLQDESWGYPIVIDDNGFFVATPSGNIYMDDGFSGTPMGPIGKLK